MKCLLDAMLVLTKQDRLCHVIHATSDPFYQTWLRQLNVMQHCKVRATPDVIYIAYTEIFLQILTIGDYPKLDTRKYYRDHLLPSVPERLRSGLDFERLYDAFGGKLAHWQDYIQDYSTFLHMHLNLGCFTDLQRSQLERQAGGYVYPRDNLS